MGPGRCYHYYAVSRNCNTICEVCTMPGQESRRSIAERGEECSTLQGIKHHAIGTNGSHSYDGGSMMAGIKNLLEKLFGKSHAAKCETAISELYSKSFSD